MTSEESFYIVLFGTRLATFSNLRQHDESPAAISRIAKGDY